MASSKVSTHSRSISLPSRPHLSIANVEEHLCRLRSSEETSTSLKCNKLAGLQDLYECVEELFQSPTTQQNLSDCAENVLCASLRLLDLCCATKDAILQMRASVQDLESSLRRREADLSTKIGIYLICMKEVNKMVLKCFSNLKKSKNNKIDENSAIFSLLREVEEISMTKFESLFSSICPPKETTKQSSWALISKLTQSKRVSCEGEEEDGHMALKALYKQKLNRYTDVSRIQQVQKWLLTLDMNMQQCEDNLDSLYRSLIKIRVSLLNVLNH